MASLSPRAARSRSAERSILTLRRPFQKTVPFGRPGPQRSTWPVEADTVLSQGTVLTESTLV